jgi:HNH endonuclease
MRLIEVPLTRGKVAIIDAEDAEAVLPFKWCARGPYAMSNLGNKCLVYLHRFLLSAPPGFEVDHIDGNGLNNRRSNLRLATRGQNRQNSRIRSNNVSGYQGVSWNSGRGMWRADIRLNGRAKFLGHFQMKEQAAIAYNDAARILFGEFAHLNHLVHQTMIQGELWS